MFAETPELSQQQGQSEGAFAPAASSGVEGAPTSASGPTLAADPPVINRKASGAAAAPLMSHWADDGAPAHVGIPSGGGSAMQQAVQAKREKSSGADFSGAGAAIQTKGDGSHGLTIFEVSEEVDKITPYSRERAQLISVWKRRNADVAIESMDFAQVRQDLRVLAVDLFSARAERQLAQERGEPPQAASGGGGGAATSAGQAPRDFRIVGSEPMFFRSVGMEVAMDFEPASEQLDPSTRLKEVVEEKEESGCFAGHAKSNSGYRGIGERPFTDGHGTPRALLTGPGRRVSHQGFKYTDAQTKGDLPAAGSGFIITRVVEEVPGNKLRLTTTKHPAATDPDGQIFTQGLGGQAVASQVVNRPVTGQDK